MRHYYKIQLALISCLSLSGCTNFLDITPTDRITNDNFPTTRQHAEVALNGIYNTLTNGSMYGGTAALSLDAATPNSYSYDNRDGVNIIAQGAQNAATGGIIGGKWGACYQGIGRANVLLDKIDAIAMTDDLKKQYRGEAKFLRGLFYAHAWLTYGGAPLILTAPDLDSQGELPRNSADEIYAQVIKDCDGAIADLPLTSSSTGRATQGAALALKARVMLYKGDYAGAATAAKAVMDLKKYSLFADYRNLFQLENEGNAEVLFDVQFKYPEFSTPFDITLTDYNSFAPLPDLINDYYMIDGLPADKSAKYNSAKPYENRDPRMNMTNILPGTMFRGAVVGVDKFGSTGVGQKKYTVYKDDAAGTTIPDGQSQINYIVLRYADVLLMYAEAQNEVSGPDQSVYDAVNLIRKRAGMPNFATGLSKDQMRQEIRHERRIELAGEGLYYYDIRRWKTAETVMNAAIYRFDGKKIMDRKFNKDRDYLLPVPTAVRDRNSKLIQNPNY